MDLVPLLATLFYGQARGVSLSAVQSALLLGLGLRRKSLDDLPASSACVSQMLALNKAVRRIVASLRQVHEAKAAESCLGAGGALAPRRRAPRCAVGGGGVAGRCARRGARRGRGGGLRKLQADQARKQAGGSTAPTRAASFALCHPRRRRGVGRRARRRQRRQQRAGISLKSDRKDERKGGKDAGKGGGGKSGRGGGKDGGNKPGGHKRPRSS